jgi:RNA polymerase sigma-B factor
MCPAAVADPEAPTAVEDSQLFDRYRRERRPEDCEALVLRFLPLARHLARRYVADNEREDLEQVAALGLMKAIDRFDPSRGIAFGSFAVPTILGELRRYFRDRGWMVRVPRSLQELSRQLDGDTETLTRELGRTPTVAELAERCGVSTEQVVEARSLATAHRPTSLDRPTNDADEAETVGTLLGHDDAGYARAEAAIDLAHLLEHLPERQRMVLRLRFEEDLVQREIAQRVGLSQMHVSRLISQSIRTLQTIAAADSRAVTRRG